MVSWLVRYGVGGGVVGGFIYLINQQNQINFEFLSFCQQLQPSQQRSYNQEEIQKFKQWLTNQGAKIDQLHFHEVQGEGLGVSIGEDIQKGVKSVNQVPWWKQYLPRKKVVAEFPLDLVISKQTISQQEKTGQIYTDAFENVGLSEEEVIGMWLMVEKARGSDSKYKCYFNLLPKQLNVPLLWNDEQLREIQGTTLYHSVQAKRRGLLKRWNEVASQLSTQILQMHGVSGECSFEDFLWGYCIYMSRAVGLPPVESATKGELIRSGDGLVPGMDFCNHSPQPTAYWTVLGADGKIGGVPSIKVVQSGGIKLQQGMEVTFDYGSRSDEQFLFVYGFLNTEDPYKQLYDEAMVKLPLPKVQDMTEELYDRMILMHKMERRPQFFLKPIRKQQSNTLAPENQYIQDDIIQILDVLLIPYEEAVQRLQDDSHKKDDVYPTFAQLYKCNKPRLMGILTTYIQLLKDTLQEIESVSEGTGPLQKDELILKVGEGNLPYWKTCALKYRMGQKSIIRQHYDAAQETLKMLITEMQNEQQNTQKQD